MKKTGMGETTFKIVNAIILTLFTLACFYPFYVIFINSISENGHQIQSLIPNGFDLESYETILKTPGVFESMGISLARTVIGTFLTVLCSSFMAFLFTQPELPGRGFFYKLVLFTMYISAGFIPYYLLINAIGLRNTFWVYVIPGAVSAYYIILIKTYIESIPSVLQESAEIDGAGILTVYFRIIMPVCKPILACIIVFSAVYQWNAWSDTLYFVTNSRLVTLQYLLWQLLNSNMASAARTASASAIGSASMPVTPTTLRMAMTFFTALPIICVYPFMQKYFVKGIMLGSVKG